MTQTQNSTFHNYNVSQLRINTWNNLKHATREITGKKTDNRDYQLAWEVISTSLNQLAIIEQYFAFPGPLLVKNLLGMAARKELQALSNEVSNLVTVLVSEAYRNNVDLLDRVSLGDIETDDDTEKIELNAEVSKNYFEVLFVDDIGEDDFQAIRDKLKMLRNASDEFYYKLVPVRTFEDALMALVFNPNIQACVVRYAIPYDSEHADGFLKPFIGNISHLNFREFSDYQLGPLLGKIIKHFRPEIDIYLGTDSSPSEIKDSTLKNFRRIFYSKEDIQEMHLTIMRFIKDRFDTPFFSALKKYSQRPTGVFHAMPISRGNSVFKSRWISDFGEFYGRNLFLAETSATTGGLDSLLQPTGPLKTAQEKAAVAFGAQHTYFSTNGTSTSNKIVVQALVEPGDLVLIDRDCHKSHHYGLVLAGALPVYLDSYPIPKYSMYGAVPLTTIKRKLLNLKKAGRLDKVKMLLLTNCTFDGLVYNVEMFMEEVLAIKPDIVFLWDEAWFAFAGFTYNFKQRTAMYVAKKLHDKYQSKYYRKQYDKHVAEIGQDKRDELCVMPDPDKVKIRVYSTQSTHKTLSSLRQGSMIHVWDEDFRLKAEDSFHEAYMTHTSTSPNYQILGSLDIGRRQVQFEGYELVEKSIELAMVLRAKINDHPKLRKYFDVLTIGDFIPKRYRKSSITEYYHPERGWNQLEEAFAHDEFVLDPTKINLFIGRTGVDGDTFKNEYLMDKYGIQINKTSRNTVLFMTNIGTTRGSVTYLLRVLGEIADELDQNFKSMIPQELKIAQERITSLTENVPPLPDFSRFHNSFRAVPGVPGGDIRRAYFLAYKEHRCEFIKLTDCMSHMEGGRHIVSASFVIPYPPGFPVLVPGQILSEEILAFLLALDVKEIHGYRPELGLRVFTEDCLNRFSKEARFVKTRNKELEKIQAADKEDH
jgi:arginine decarboxylase